LQAADATMAIVGTESAVGNGEESPRTVPPGSSAVLDTQLETLVEAGIALNRELSFDGLLRRLVETAVRLTGARYGTLGVVDAAGSGLERFITVGVDDATRQTIGEPPKGRGLPGAVIADRRALRLADLSQDPCSVGFPSGHPVIKTFLGMPVELRGVVFGNLYLSEKADSQEFSQADEKVVRLLAAQAAVAIENARLYESAQNWSRQLDSLNEAAKLLSSPSSPSDVLHLAVVELRALLGCRDVVIARPDSEGALRVEAADGAHADGLIGLRLTLEGADEADRLLGRRSGERIDSLLDDPEIDQRLPRLVGASTALYVPLLVRDTPTGIIAAFDKNGVERRFSDADVRLADAFADRAAFVIELSERAGRQAMRAEAEARERERTRLARELHDQTSRALTSILLALEPLEEQVGEELGQLRDLVTTALADVGRLATELRVPALDAERSVVRTPGHRALPDAPSGRSVRTSTQGGGSHEPCSIRVQGRPGG